MTRRDGAKPLAPWPRTFRLKNALIATGTSAIAVALATALLVAQDYRTYRAACEVQATRLARMVGSSTSAALLFLDADAATELLQSLKSEPSIRLATVFDAEGKPFARYQRGKFTQATVPTPTWPPVEATQWRDDALVTSHPILLDHDTIGAVLIEADLRDLDVHFRHVRLSVLAVWLASVGAAFAVTWRLQRPLVQPIALLSEAAATVSSRRDYTVRVAKLGDDELGALTDAFNAMLAQIEESDRRLRGQQEDLERRVAERTEQLREREIEARQSQKMEAVGRLAGGVAHDFNNLLTAISGYAELLLAGLDHEHRLRNYVEEVQRAATRATQLTRQLLAFSRKQVLDPRVLDLNTTVRDLSQMLRRLIGANIELRTTALLATGTVRADPGQIEQVIVNLVVNARDAMSSGHILIGTTDITVGPEGDDPARGLAPGDYVALLVRDNGRGMSPEVVSHIFEPFFTTKETGKGTGLGLSTVYGIVTQSGGKVTVESREGEGTSFQIFLPRLSQPVTASTAVVGPAPDPGSETILLVEDEPQVRELTQLVLQSAGYRVLSAENGPRALALAQRTSGEIHLLLSDVVMPFMKGNEVYARLRPLRPELKVLLISGYTDDEILRRGILDSVTPFLQKPFTPPALLSKVRQVLDAAMPHTLAAATASSRDEEG